jgi:hypothetical protein
MLLRFFASPPHSEERVGEIESGRQNGSISAMKKISEALKGDLDDLVQRAAGPARSAGCRVAVSG